MARLETIIMSVGAGQPGPESPAGSQTISGEVTSPIPGMQSKIYETLVQHYPPKFIEEQRGKYGTHEDFLKSAEVEAKRIDAIERVKTNAALPDDGRLQAAEELIGPLSEEQGKALQRMHEVGKDRPGAGVYNYNQAEIKEKVRIGREKTETGEEVFSKEQRHALMEAGLAGFLNASEVNNFDLTQFGDPRIKKIASRLETRGMAGKIDEEFIYSTKEQIRRLSEAAEIDPTEEDTIVNILNDWQKKVDDPLLSYADKVRIEEQARKEEDSGYNQIKRLYEHYKSIDETLLPPTLQTELEERINFYEKEFRDSMEKYAFWDRSWGRIVLTGRTPEEVVKGVDNFLRIATDEQSNFDANRNIQDADGLNQEIQRVGQQVGMKREEILEQVARAEGTLLISVADHFAVRWNVNEWHQVATLIGKHIDTRLNAVSKAHEAEVMHAADILDNDEEYDQYSRQARFTSEVSAQNDQAAASKRAEVRRKLEVRIALSQLKDINTVIRENFMGIESEIDSFGFVRNSTPAIKVFENPQYLAEIERIDNKLKTINAQYEQGLSPGALTDKEKQFIVLDRIRPHKKTADLVVIDQTDEQFGNLYAEFGGFGTKTGYNAEIQRLKSIIPIVQKKINSQMQLTNDEIKQVRFWQRDRLLKKIESGDQLTDAEIRPFPEILKAQQAVDLAIKTREVFFIGAEKACASVKTRHNTTEGQGELLSYNDVVRLNKFVRERSIVSLSQADAQAITSATRNGAGLMYVDIADKLEFINLSNEVIREKRERSELVKNAKEALRLITLTSEESRYQVYVQAVEDVQEKVLEKLKEKGSSLAVTDIDTIIEQVYAAEKIAFPAQQTARDTHSQSVHRGQPQKRASIGYSDIVSREDADPQYNFSMTDDQKYSSLLLSDEIKAAAYNPGHPYYCSTPAVVRRLLDPDGTKLVRTGDADVDRANVFKMQETQRRFHFAVDAVKVFGAFYKPDLYEDKSEKPTIAEIVVNIRNAPFIGRRMIEQRIWTLWNRGQAYRGRGFLKYLESNFRGLDHTVGRRGLRGVVASYNGLSQPKGFGYKPDFSGIMDELAAERWLEEAKSADAIRPVYIGGQVGQDPNFEGIFKKILNTPGQVNSDIVTYEKQAAIGAKGTKANYRSSHPLIRIRDQRWKDMAGGDFEKAIDDTEKIWKRVTTYGKSLGFTGNTSQIPLAAKFSGDTAVRRMAYWAVTHPEAELTYNINMDIARTILEPIPLTENYFGRGANLLTELLRRQILNK